MKSGLHIRNSELQLMNSRKSTHTVQHSRAVSAIHVTSTWHGDALLAIKAVDRLRSSATAALQYKQCSCDANCANDEPAHDRASEHGYRCARRGGGWSRCRGTTVCRQLGIVAEAARCREADIPAANACAAAHFAVHDGAFARATDRRP